MNHSLNQIADQILNAVYSGLKSPANFSISKEQIKDEIAQARNRHLERMVASGITNLESFRQTIPKLTVTKKDFANVTGYTVNKQVHHATIPELPTFPGIKPISWVTAMDKAYPFKIVYGSDIFYTAKDKFSGTKPTVWIQDTNLWILYPPVANLQHVTVRTIVENPRAMNGIGNIKFTDDDPYPIPLALVDEIRNKLVNDYIRQYRMGTMQPVLMATDANISTPQE